MSFSNKMLHTAMAVLVSATCVAGSSAAHDQACIGPKGGHTHRACFAPMDSASAPAYVAKTDGGEIGQKGGYTQRSAPTSVHAGGHQGAMGMGDAPEGIGPKGGPSRRF